VFRKASGVGSSSNSTESNVKVVSSEFKRFQRLYIVVYLLMMGADWLQGPYVYALYQHYGFSKSDIALLFIVGFGSSLVFGTIVGSAADKYGRRLLCLVFGLTYGASCLTKHIADFNVLLVGRLLGGIATSILFSSFESWMVSEHHKHNYPEEWLGITFSVCTSGNGIVAIVAGIVASFVRSKW
jgi:MFS family permease